MNTLNNVNPFTATVPALENVSDKYAFIPTCQFIDDVKSLGYTLESTRQPRKGLGMHSMTFSHPSLPKLNGLDLRLLATNSHNATSAFRLHLQIGVSVCANILIANELNIASHTRIVHRGYAIDKVSNAIDSIRSEVDGILNQIHLMQSTSVTNDSISAFLFEATKLRDAKPYRINDLQYARHFEQRDNTAWNVFNRVQESIIKGGFVTKEIAPFDYSSNNGGVNIENYIPGRKARELTNIREVVNINRSLWRLSVDTLLKAA